MSHPISLPDDLYEQLATVAAHRGETPDELVATWVRLFTSNAATGVAPTTEAEAPPTDPLAPFIGAFASGGPAGWIERHDADLAR